MKKSQLAFVLSLLLLKNSCGVALADIPINQKAFLPPNKKIECYQQYPEWFIVEKNTQYVDQLYAVTTLLPEFVIKQFNENETKVIVCSSSDELTNKYGKIRNVLAKDQRPIGFYDFDNNIVWIVTSNIKNIKEELKKMGLTDDELVLYSDELLSQIVITNYFVHEIGHAIDYENDRISSDPSFIEIFKAELSSFQNMMQYKIASMSQISCIDQNTEYFASAFAAYILYPDQLYYCAPNTFNYIQNMINEKQNEYNCALG